MSEFILKWDESENRLVGEDPDSGDRIPVSFESLTSNFIQTEEQQINDYEFFIQGNEPEDPAVGDVWINNGIAFGDELTGSNVKTWDGEEWIAEQKEETDEIPDSAIYYEGDDELEDDWEENVIQASPTFTKETDHLRVLGEMVDEDRGEWVTKETIDLSPYDTLEIDWECPQQALDDDERSRVYVGVDDSQDVSFATWIREDDGAFSRRTQQLDISGENGDNYVGVGVHHGGTSGAGEGDDTEILAYQIHLLD